MDIKDLKRLAGITDAIGNPVSPVPVDKGTIMREQNIKPGTDEWFKLWLPNDPSRFPSGFRGRKK